MHEIMHYIIPVETYFLSNLLRLTDRKYISHLNPMSTLTNPVYSIHYIGGVADTSTDYLSSYNQYIIVSKSGQSCPVLIVPDAGHFQPCIQGILHVTVFCPFGLPTTVSFEQPVQHSCVCSCGGSAYAEAVYTKLVWLVSQLA